MYHTMAEEEDREGERKRGWGKTSVYLFIGNLLRPEWHSSSHETRAFKVPSKSTTLHGGHICRTQKGRTRSPNGEGDSESLGKAITQVASQAYVRSCCGLAWSLGTQQQQQWRTLYGYGFLLHWRSHDNWGWKTRPGKDLGCCLSQYILWSCR